jgi:hypothetical protein
MAVERLAPQAKSYFGTVVETGDTIQDDHHDQAPFEAATN